MIDDPNLILVGLYGVTISLIGFLANRRAIKPTAEPTNTNSKPPQSPPPGGGSA